MNVDEMSVEEIDAYIAKIVSDAVDRWNDMSPEQRAWEHECHYVDQMASIIASLLADPDILEVRSEWDDDDDQPLVTIVKRFPNKEISIQTHFTFEG